MDPEIERILRTLSPEAHQALEIAAQAARTQGFLGIEHLLLGLLCLPRIANELRRAGIDTSRVINQVQSYIQNNPQLHGEHIICTPRAGSILSGRALTIARNRGHVLVEPEDLLTAVLEERHVPFIRDLGELGLSLDRVLACFERPVRLTIPEELRPWCRDLTAQAEQGELLPLIDREEELRQVVRVLLRPVGAACPVLVGDAGVGKTAIVEGLAQEIVNGRIPQLRDCRIVQVDINAMLAGCVLRGMFEERLRRTVEFAKNPPSGVRIILFIDEIHHIVGAGLAAGIHVDAAQILLQPLGRGEIQLIGATTWEEYKQHIEQEEALSRRFTVVAVKEPSIDATRTILQGVLPTLEKRFEKSGAKIRFKQEALDTALKLAVRYLLSRRLPDKPLQWLVEAGVNCFLDGREEVTADDVAIAVSAATGIPIDIMFRQQTLWTPEYWEKVLKARVKGQDHVVADIARRILANLGPLRGDARRPIGVFLFVGPTGVGKTELAKAITELLFGDESRMIRLDMSEFKDPGSAQKLIGPPRGIVGAGRGLLTDRIREQPYTVVLLDEFEKADTSVRALFLQVFDEGWLTDGLGRKVYFSDAIIIMTSNLGQEEYQRYLREASLKPGFHPPKDVDATHLIPPEQARDFFFTTIGQKLSPELQSRIDKIYVFTPLSLETLKEIARALLDDLKDVVHRETGKQLQYTERAVEVLAEHGLDPLRGARALKQALEEFKAWEVSPHLNKGHSFLVDVTSCGPEGGRPALRLVVDPEMALGEEVA